MKIADLTKAFSDQADRIVSDPHGVGVVIAGETMHTLYEGHIGTLDVAASEADVATVHDEFCSKFPCLGTPVAPALLERFGHVMSMNSFRRYVAKPGPAIGGLPPRAGMIGPVPTRPMSSSEANEVLLDRLGSELVRPDGTAVWCFQSESSPEAPYDDVDETLLPCRLGLKRSKESDGTDANWIAFTVVPPPTEWHRPTFADTTWSFLTDWKPGGFTIALADYDCGPGLPEAIGSGVAYGQVTLAAGPFAAAWPAP